MSTRRSRPRPSRAVWTNRLAVQLPPDLEEKVTIEADERRVSYAQVLRDAVVAYFQPS